jgi:DUF4097 and DUF4098 domain-containing protein YvlB
VRLEQLQGSLSVDTTSGEVQASWGTLPAGATLRVHTTSGDVRLRAPSGTRLRGQISTRSGSIHSDLPGTSDRREHEVAFSASGDAVEINVHTSSGDVSIHERS